MTTYYNAHRSVVVNDSMILELTNRYLTDDPTDNFISCNVIVTTTTSRRIFMHFLSLEISYDDQSIDRWVSFIQSFSHSIIFSCHFINSICLTFSFDWFVCIAQFHQIWFGVPLYLTVTSPQCHSNWTVNKPKSSSQSAKVIFVRPKSSAINKQESAWIDKHTETKMHACAN